MIRKQGSTSFKFLFKYYISGTAKNLEAYVLAYPVTQHASAKELGSQD
jgi:hypothetical protein